MSELFGGNMVFPIHNTGHGAPFDEGMSLRDYIAIHAMQASLMRQDDTVGRHAQYAYKVADAMLEVRNGEQ
jgi:hypothetical protein